MAQKTQCPVPETQDRTLRARTARTRPAQRRSTRAPSRSRRRPRAHPREALPLSARRAAPPVTPAVAPAPTPPAAASPLEQPPRGSRGPRTGPRQGPARRRSSSAWSEAAAGRAARRGAVGPVAPSPAPAPTRNISWTGWPSTSSSCWRSCRKPHPLDHSRQPRRSLTASQGGVFVLLVVGGQEVIFLYICPRRITGLYYYSVERGLCLFQLFQGKCQSVWWSVVGCLDSMQILDVGIFLDFSDVISFA